MGFDIANSILYLRTPRVRLIGTDFNSRKMRTVSAVGNCFSCRPLLLLVAIAYGMATSTMDMDDQRWRRFLSNVLSTYVCTITNTYRLIQRHPSRPLSRLQNRSSVVSQHSRARTLRSTAGGTDATWGESLSTAATRSGSQWLGEIATPHVSSSPVGPPLWSTSLNITTLLPTELRF